MLRVPEESRGCANWILQQSPERTAAVLALCESAYHALTSEISSNDVQRHAVEVQRMTRELQQQTEEASAMLNDEIRRRDEEHQQRVEEVRRSLSEAHVKTMSVAQQTADDAERALRHELDVMRGRLEESDTARIGCLAQQQSAVESAVEARTSQIQQDYARDAATARSRMEDERDCLLAQVDKLKASTAEHRAEVAELKASIVGQIDRDRQASAQAAAEREAQYATRTDELKQDLAQCKERMNAYEARAIRTAEEKEAAAANFNERLLSLHEQQRSLVANLSGTPQAKGDLGENIAHVVFADLALGTLECTAKNPNPGYADYYWRYDYHKEGVSGIRAQVEIKNKAQLKKVDDLKKFETNVRDAVHQNRINCAVLISERCRIQDTKPIDMRIEHGVLVVRASRAADDELSVASLVKLTFTTIAQLWPHLCLHTNTKQDTVVQNVSAFLCRVSTQVASLDQQIQFLNNTGLRLQREGIKLRDMRDAVVTGMETLQMLHGQLSNGMHAESLEIDITSDVAEAIETWYQEHGCKRYPKAPTQLDLDTQQQANVSMQTFQKALACVKKRRQPGPKPAAASSKRPKVAEVSEVSQVSEGSEVSGGSAE